MLSFLAVLRIRNVKPGEIPFFIQLGKDTRKEFRESMVRANLHYFKALGASEIPPEAPMMLFFATYGEVLATVGIVYQILKDRKEQKFSISYTKPDGTRIEANKVDDLKKILDDEEEAKRRERRT